MENANRLSRKASELEQELKWTEAAAMHQRAASAYNNIKSFDYDPVATLTLSSLVNKHRRWAEYCEQKSEALGSGAQDQSHAASDLDSDARPAGADPLKRDQSNDDEHGFEDFWHYMQCWLANPAAFTRPTLPSSNRDAGAGSTLGSQVAGPSIMESFYLVGPNPEQSASIYGSATPKTVAAPLQVLDEVDEADEEGAGNTLSVLAAPSPGGATRNDADKSTHLDRLEAENKKLRKQLRLQSERIRILESAAQENNMLKSSILSFREEFHRHANVTTLPRIMEQSSSPRRVQTPPTDVAANSQVRQLESQLELLQLENSKQVQVAKYRDRWERLKESAKRKRQQLENQTQ
ncbi:hypothetical protein GGI03_002823 [Coemansia sp. RSA 2337]|nr:hypothetical protein GGI14_004552 [Coemansia sp. S680]KAJ2423861.1 hypothetical protein GGF41_002976 [Coemansia sp. RSA 2531]KAJ2465148.1 hypothetical protein GGI03_002823 [Coemansia sp. RSA 2337]